MVANRILNVLLNLLAIVLLPIMILSTLVLGIAVTLTFGLLLLPISIIWFLLFFLPLLGLSYICHRIPLLRTPLGIFFIPWAIIAYIFVILMPSMGEREGRASKIMLCETWPFSWEFWQFISHRLDLDSFDPAARTLSEVIERVAHSDALKQRVVAKLSAGIELDGDLMQPRDVA